MEPPVTVKVVAGGLPTTGASAAQKANVMRRQSTVSSVSRVSFRRNSTSSRGTSKYSSCYASSRRSDRSQNSRRSSKVIQRIPDKVCEGRMQMYDVKSSTWKRVYVVLTAGEAYIYKMQREGGVSRMGFRSGPTSWAIGQLLGGPYPLKGLKLTFLSEVMLGRRCCFKATTSSFSVYLSCALEKGGNTKEGREREAAMLERWAKALEAVILKEGARERAAMAQTSSEALRLRSQSTVSNLTATSGMRKSASPMMRKSRSASSLSNRSSSKSPAGGKRSSIRSQKSEGGGTARTTTATSTFKTNTMSSSMMSSSGVTNTALLTTKGGPGTTSTSVEGSTVTGGGGVGSTAGALMATATAGTLTVTASAGATLWTGAASSMGLEAGGTTSTQGEGGLSTTLKTGEGSATVTATASAAQEELVKTDREGRGSACRSRKASEGSVGSSDTVRSRKFFHPPPQKWCTRISALPVPCSSSMEEAMGCCACGCLLTAPAASTVTWYPKPAIAHIAIPCPFYMTSHLICQGCRIKNDSARLKKAQMNMVYKRVLEVGGDVTHDPELSRYALKHDATNMTWTLDRAHSVVCLGQDVFRTPLRASVPCRLPEKPGYG